MHKSISNASWKWFLRFDHHINLGTAVMQHRTWWETAAKSHLLKYFDSFHWNAGDTQASRWLLKQQASSHLSEVWGDEENKHTSKGKQDAFWAAEKSIYCCFWWVSTCCFCSAPPIWEIPKPPQQNIGAAWSQILWDHIHREADFWGDLQQHILKSNQQFLTVIGRARMFFLLHFNRWGFFFH